MKLKRSHVLTLLALAVVAAAPAHASGGGPAMPWDSPLQSLADNLTGPLARVVVLIAAGVAGLTWALSDHGSGAKKVGQLVMGGAIMVFAAQFLTGLGLGGALV